MDKPNDTPLQAIRKHCVQCMGGAFSLVTDCTAGPASAGYQCPLWRYRFGKKPWAKRPDKAGRPVAGLFPTKGKKEGKAAHA